MTERIPFSAYFILSSLQSMGWPRKPSLFGRKGVPGTALGAAWTGMVQGSIGLGAGKPRLAAQLLTQLFVRRDWATQSGDALIAGLDPVTLITKQPDTLPWHVLVQRETSIFTGFIPWDDLLPDDAINIASTRCGQGLIYGLAHPTQAARALDSDRAQYVAAAPGAIAAGLQIPSAPAWPDNHSYFEWTGQIVAAYERVCGQLPQPHPQLLTAAIVRARLSAH